MCSRYVVGPNCRRKPVSRIVALQHRIVLVLEWDYRRDRAEDSSRAMRISFFTFRGVGEVSIVPPPTAAANAIYNAIGARMKELPMSPPRILKALGSNIVRLSRGCRAPPQIDESDHQALA